MKKFNGFPRRMEFTAIPNLFFSGLLPQITDMAELKVTLQVMAALYRKRGFPQYVTFGEMQGNASLMEDLGGTADPPTERLRHALQMATERGTLLHLVLAGDGVSEDIYLLNTAANREAAGKLQGGEMKLEGQRTTAPAYTETEPAPDIFTLYEENIGMLTPLIADELREAEKSYPAGWIRDAVKEAVSRNRRKWSFISTVLQRWAAEGRSDGAYQRDSQADPDKYVKGKYGHMVRH